MISDSSNVLCGAPIVDYKTMHGFIDTFHPDHTSNIVVISPHVNRGFRGVFYHSIERTHWQNARLLPGSYLLTMHTQTSQHKHTHCPTAPLTEPPCGNTHLARTKITKSKYTTRDDYHFNLCDPFNIPACVVAQSEAYVCFSRRDTSADHAARQ